MEDALSGAVEAGLSRLVETRHHLHRHPELSDCEEQTAAFVSDRLTELGVAHRVGVGGHGVVGDLVGPEYGKTIALRADMDALPIQEETGLPYASVNPGVMHACGHDAHTAILLTVAETLTALGEPRAGTVRLLFQPAEETVGGAVRMCVDGAMDGVDAIIALHGWPQLPVGHIGLRCGPAMAAADTFDITVRGQGAHAAYPHLSVDPVTTAARLILSLQTIVSRETDPVEPVVLTVARMSAGTAYNIIPATAHIAGTVRTLSAAARDLMPERIRRIAEGECAASGAACDVAYTRGAPPVVNDPVMVELLAGAARNTVGDASVVPIAYPSMGAEDFAFFAERVPGVMFRLGIGDGPVGHTSGYDFDDRALPVGVEVMCRAALAYLSG